MLLTSGEFIHIYALQSFQIKTFSAPFRASEAYLKINRNEIHSQVSLSYSSFRLLNVLYQLTLPISLNSSLKPLEVFVESEWKLIRTKLIFPLI